MVAHLWANQAQTSARNATNNFFFDLDTIYSYGSHFPIARHITNKRKQKAILFTTRGYYTTTAKHIREVRGALRGRDELVFNVPEINRYGLSDNKAILDDYGRRIVAIGEKIPLARQNKTGLINQLENLVAEANSYAKFIGQAAGGSRSISKRKKRKPPRSMRSMKTTARPAMPNGKPRLTPRWKNAAKSWRYGLRGPMFTNKN